MKPPRRSPVAVALCFSCSFSLGVGVGDFLRKSPGRDFGARGRDGDKAPPRTAGPDALPRDMGPSGTQVHLHCGVSPGCCPWDRSQVETGLTWTGPRQGSEVTHARTGSGFTDAPLASAPKTTVQPPSGQRFPWGAPRARSLSPVQLYVTSWSAAHQASLTVTISLSLLKLMSIQS